MVKVAYNTAYADREEIYDEADSFKLVDGHWFALRKGGEEGGDEGKTFAYINASVVLSIAAFSEDRELIPA